MQWIQYHLDSFSTVEQVIKSAFLVIPDGWSWHFFVADKGGNCAVLEYIDNKLVVHTGRDMPVTALCNRTYEEESNLLKNYEGFGGKKAINLADKDIPRFVRSALMLKKYDPEVHTSAVDYVFSILENLSSKITRRSYVVDIRNGVAYFRTGSRPQVRHFSLNSFDFSCDRPVRILDLNARYSGDVTDKFREYSFQENRRIAESWLNHVLQMDPDKTKEDRIEAGLMPEHIDRYARYPELSLKKEDIPTPQNHYGLTELYWAAYQGDLQKVRELLGKGADVNAGTQIGTTALMAAAQAGHLQVARHLIDSGADIDTVDARGNTALIAALLFGHSDIAIFLIQQGANVKLSNGLGLGPLHYAACNGDLPVLELLTKRSVDLEASSKSVFNALMSATESGQLDAVKFLLAKGANIDAVDANGHTPLLISLLLRHWDVAELLIESGADVLIQNKEGITPWKAASGGKNKEIINLLKDKGAKPKFLGLF
jgi:ankyrin repeat protein